MSGDVELREIGGPSRASRWGLLLRMEEVVEVVDEEGVKDGGVGGNGAVLARDNAGGSEARGGPEPN